MSLIQLVSYALLMSFSSLSLAIADVSQTVPLADTASDFPHHLRISTGEFAPWSGQHLAHQGHVSHIIREAFATQDITVEFVYLPWKRAYEEARYGKFDATSYWYENADRREAMLFSDPLIVNRTVFFQRAQEETIEWETFTDLTPYRMSATVGFTYTEEFYRAIDTKTISPIMVPSDTQNIKLLMADRVDLFVTDEMAGFYMAAQLSIDPRKLKVIEPALSAPEGYLLTSKSHPNAQWIIERFNAGLKIIKTNGTYQRILNRADNNSF